MLKNKRNHKSLRRKYMKRLFKFIRLKNHNVTQRREKQAFPHTVGRFIN